MKTELLALIDELVKSELYVTEGKFSAAKDAKRIRADIVFLLDKAEQEGAPAAVETCAVCCKGQARLVRICDACSSEYAGPNETRRAPAAVEPVAYLHDDGYWTAAKTEQGRALSDRLHFAGSPKIGVHLHPAPTTKAEPAPAEVAMPDAISSLTGDTALAHEQCRAVVHLALAVAEVYSSNALIVANDARMSDQIGAASAEVMEYLGDTLNSTDATTEEDEWLEPIFEAAQERWPAAAQAAPADALDAETVKKAQRYDYLRDLSRYFSDCVDGAIYVRQIGATSGVITSSNILTERDLDTEIDAAIAAQETQGARP